MKLRKARSWQKAATGLAGNVQLFGVNIFDYKWTDTGENIDVGKFADFDIFEVHIDGERKRFAAGEVSNCVWEFYIYTF